FGEVEDYVVENTPPVCNLVSIDWGPPLTAVVAMQDAESGLAAIETLEALNLTVNIPPFEMGVRTPVPVQVALIDQNSGGEATWRLTDVAGNQSICDPAKSTVVRGRGKPTPTILSGINASERHVYIKNGVPGVTNLRVEVNGRRFESAHLADGETLTLDISSALRPGANNNVSVVPLGAPAGTAVIIVSE